ncbi:MAG: serine protein kinase RIO [Candidatus Bathyarchaeia archaeon]
MLMSDRSKVEKRAEKMMRAYEEESLMLEKRSEEFEVIEEVFDRPTLEAIYKLMQKKVIDKIYGVVKSGKEARIYHGRGFNGEELALKIYLTTTSEFRKGMFKYIDGDPRFKKVKKDVRGKNNIIYAWTKKEFSNLSLARDAGVRVPNPIAFYRNVLVMSFIGGGGVPAPLLKEVELLNPGGFYQSLLDNVRLLYSKAGLVHGDLSEYNIMVLDDSPVIFDVSQAVLKSHPLSDELLLRDVERINFYFDRLGVDTYRVEDIERWVKGGAKVLHKNPS